jgi:hypothetical protein
MQNKPIRFRPTGAKPYGFVLQLIMLIDLAEVPESATFLDYF